MAPTAWVATARCSSSRSGIRASASTTTCAAGTPSRISDRANSISSTATTISSVTVPAGYIVAATGTLQNAAEVLTPTQIARLAQAAKSDTPVHIVTQEELKSGAARPKKTGTLTWQFKAKNVRDAVWAASPDYMWDASSWQGHMAFGYYRPSADRHVEGRRRHVAHVDHGILGALVPVSVSADQRRRGPDQRHGIPDAGDGGQERRQVRRSTTSSRTRSATCGIR